MYIGIDIGLHGAITLINDGGDIILCESMPTTTIEVAKKKRQQYDIPAIFELFKNIERDYLISAMAVERLTPIPTLKSQSSFGLGLGQGIFRTIAVTRQIPYFEIMPKTWQKDIFTGVSYNDTKIASSVVARRLQPAFDFRLSTKCKNDDSGKTDSYLIARYLLKIK